MSSFLLDNLDDLVSSADGIFLEPRRVLLRGTACTTASLEEATTEF
jgi:hypothetical protein